MFVVVHKEIRNDEHVPYPIRIKAVSDVEDGLNVVANIILGEWEEHTEEELTPVKDKVRGYILDPGVWKWEWRRRGNGDFFQIREIEDLSDFEFSISEDNAKEIEFE